MPKVTKTLGNNKVRACESPDFAHNKEDVSVYTPPYMLLSIQLFVLNLIFILFLDTLKAKW